MSLLWREFKTNVYLFYLKLRYNIEPNEKFIYDISNNEIIL